MSTTRLGNCSLALPLLQGSYIDALISYKEYQVDEMAARLQTLHADRCDQTSCTCTPHACEHTHDGFACIDDTFGTPPECVDGCGDVTRGREMDMRQSTLMYSTLVNESQRAVQEATCFSKGMDDLWIENADNDPDQHYQFFASDLGLMRQFPCAAAAAPPALALSLCAAR